MIDEIIVDSVPHNVSLLPIALLNDKGMFLLRAKEEDLVSKKNYARSLLVMVKNELVTSNYADTKLLLAELKLFDRGNKQNKFTTVEKFDGDLNLKLKLLNGHMYISRAEANAITGIYEESKIGISIQRLLESELKFTVENLVELLSKAGHLDKKIKK